MEIYVMFAIAMLYLSDINGNVRNESYVGGVIRA